MRIALALMTAAASFASTARLSAGAAATTRPMTVAQMTTNGRAGPLGIAADDVSFGWADVAAGPGATQAAYQLCVGTRERGDDVWDSGRVDSDRQVDVRPPADRRLAAATRYFWQVRTWDGAGRAGEWSEPAWFETGLLSPDDWKGATWIGRRVATTDADGWRDYTVDADFTIERDAFGVLLRASPDAGNGYPWQVNVAGDRPLLKTHKRVDGKYADLARVDLSELGFTNEGLRRGSHKLIIDVRGATIATRLDGQKIDERSDDTFRTGLVGFRTFDDERATVRRVTVTDAAGGRVLMEPVFAQGESKLSGGGVADGAYRISGDTDAVFADGPASLPLMRGVVNARDGVTSARVYATARGIYQLSVNGTKAGDQFLAPGWTDYDKRVQCQTYDVTGLMKKGTNVVGAALADGWYRGNVGLSWSRVYGNTLGFIARIKLTYADGTTEWFATDGRWLAGDGPFVRADLQGGETYDAAREQPGWDTAAFQATGWAPAAVLPYGYAELVPQPDEPIRNTQALAARRHVARDPKRFVYDLGQNIVGVARVTMTGRKGQTVTIRYAEEVYRVGDRRGEIYTDNLRGARATDTYTFAADGTVTYQPTFTQHGFRYVELTGLDEPPPPPEAVVGVVLGSALPDVGDLATSDAMLSQLVRNIRWGQRGNFVSIPTDTPARDERLGWTGDISLFAPTASRYQDTRAFLTKWMDDVRDAQKPDGNVPAVVPQPRREFDATGVGWSDAFITVPYAVWRASGDARIVRRNWDAMRRFYRFVHDSATRDGNLVEEGRSSWFSGDWLSLEKKVDRLEEHKVIATAYFAEDTRMMAEMAAGLGETDQAAEWSALVPKVWAAFVETFRKPDGSIYTGTQTAYAMALGMNLIADPAQREQTAAKFVAKLAADGDHLRTGFLGTPWLLPALTGIGREDLAARLLLNEDYPSWGFEVKQGATTVWERWNTIGPDGRFGPVQMNSFNHYAYGAVGDWMFGNLGGLQAIEPGYRRARIAPLVGLGGLTEARCGVLTPAGPLACEWKIAGRAADARRHRPRQHDRGGRDTVRERRRGPRGRRAGVGRRRRDPRVRGRRPGHVARGVRRLPV